MENKNPLVRLVAYGKIKKKMNQFKGKQIDPLERNMMRGLFLRKLKDFSETTKQHSKLSLLERLVADKVKVAEDLSNAAGSINAAPLLPVMNPAHASSITPQMLNQMIPAFRESTNLGLGEVDEDLSKDYPRKIAYFNKRHSSSFEQFSNPVSKRNLLEPPQPRRVLHKQTQLDHLMISEEPFEEELSNTYDCQLEYKPHDNFVSYCPSNQSHEIRKVESKKPSLELMDDIIVQPNYIESTGAQQQANP